MDASGQDKIAEEIMVAGGESPPAVDATRRSSRSSKPIAKTDGSNPETVRKSGMMENGIKTSDNDSVGRVRATDGDAGSEESSIRMGAAGNAQGNDEPPDKQAAENAADFVKCVKKALNDQLVTTRQLQQEIKML
jgi:hypothetical protein